MSSLQIPLPPVGTEELASLLKAAADPLRLDILRLLARDSFGVTELCRIFGIKQSGMSHHLKVMAKAGLVATRREGNSIFYRRVSPGSDSASHNLLQSLFQTLDSSSIPAELELQRSEIYRERSAASEVFFAENAKKIREQQDLIASFDTYGDLVTEALNSLSLAHCDQVLEIGPGEGQLLPFLARKFNSVTALDSSSKMLERAKDTCKSSGTENIEWIHADSSILNHRDIEADCIIMNMVLHHTPSPARVFQDAAKVLNGGGVLLVTELCPHDQQWAKEACGDLWLGFDPADLLSWAKQDGLEEGPSQYIALRNGFQIQIRQFQKPATTIRSQ